MQLEVDLDHGDARLNQLAERILTEPALRFLADLHETFGERQLGLLADRHERDAVLAAGGTLDFRAETAHIRADATWRVAAPAPGLADRRVEITGPTEAKMAINALNSGAKVWLADFEDSNTPLFANMLGGQANLSDAVQGTLAFDAGDKQYRLGDSLATIVVRPRGLHMTERHLRANGLPISASLFDFGLYLFHCAHRQLDAGAGPYFYLAKLESHLEARFWNDVFIFAQEYLGLPRGTIRATVLIETYPAAFEMEEILFELREHSAGLNAGRWDQWRCFKA